MTKFRRKRKLFPLLCLAGGVLVCCSSSPSVLRPSTLGRLFLFDGRKLGRWKKTAFPYAGPIVVRDNSIILGRGGYLSGITWSGDLPAVDYILRLEAKRVEGHDFFCGITFPYKETFATLVLGGWGGYTTGLSNIDGLDASENGTSNVVMFENGRWYGVRLVVSKDKIEAWVDRQKIVDIKTAGRKIDLRADVEKTKPLSIMTFNTTGAVRHIYLEKIGK